MIDYEQLDQAYAAVSRRWPEAKPSHGAILGSGWSDLVESFNVKDTLAFEDIPGLGKPGVEGHSGRLAWVESAGVETFIFQGRRHYYEGEGWTPIALPLYIMKKMNVGTLVVTNAAGGLREDLTPGTLMIVDDHINNMGVNPLLGVHNPIWGPRFPDQSHVYDPDLRALVARVAASIDEPIKSGVYLACSGPVYETPAEIRSFMKIGANAVGMSTVPEAMLASAAGLKVLGISCITNLAAGISKNDLTHEEVKETTQTVMPRMQKLFQHLWRAFAQTSP